MNHPRKIDFITICRALPQLAVRFQTVIPDQFWTRADDDRNAVEVYCPCGHSPTILSMIPTACECDRWFVYDGHRVRVARCEPADSVAV